MHEVGTGKSLGEAFRDRDHLISHLGGTEDQEEPYYVPSLVVNALKAAGAGQAWYWDLFKQRKPGSFLSDPKQYARFIQRYMYRQLGLA